MKSAFLLYHVAGGLHGEVQIDLGIGLWSAHVGKPWEGPRGVPRFDSGSGPTPVIPGSWLWRSLYSCSHLRSVLDSNGGLMYLPLVWEDGDVEPISQILDDLFEFCKDCAW